MNPGGVLRIREPTMNLEVTEVTTDGNRVGVSIERVGSTVTIALSYATGAVGFAGAARIDFGTTVYPLIAYMPRAISTITFPIIVQSEGTKVMGKVVLYKQGYMRIFPGFDDNTSLFVPNADWSWPATSFSYVIGLREPPPPQ